MIDWY